MKLENLEELKDTAWAEKKYSEKKNEVEELQVNHRRAKRSMDKAWDNYFDAYDNTIHLHRFMNFDTPLRDFADDDKFCIAHNAYDAAYHAARDCRNKLSNARDELAKLETKESK